MRRTLAPLLVLPLAAAGTLVAHAAAYAALGAPSEGVHGYLAHLPQLLMLLALPALLSAAITARSTVPPAWPFAATSIALFVLQEHVERLAHTGSLPFLLDRPVFLLGLALQLPVGLVVWLLARALLRAADPRAARRSAPPRVSDLALPLAAFFSLASALRLCRARAPRGPPVLRAA
jgi:hypothetical protein